MISSITVDINGGTHDEYDTDELLQAYKVQIRNEQKTDRQCWM